MPTIFFNRLASNTPLGKAPNGSICPYKDPQKLTERAKTATKLIASDVPNANRAAERRIESDSAEEELALFNSYRNGALTAQRLGSEPQMLKERRHKAAMELSAKETIHPATIEQVCSVLTKRITNATDHEKQSILKGLQIAVTIKSDEVLVRTLIPVASDALLSASTLPQEYGRKEQVIPIEVDIPVEKDPKPSGLKLWRLTRSRPSEFRHGLQP